MPLKPRKQNEEANFHDLRHGAEFARTEEKHGAATARKQMIAIALKEARKRADGGRAAAERVLPPNHKLGLRVPKGGSMCADCRFLATSKTCGNPRFVEWNGSPRLPAPANEYCCDLYEPRTAKRRADGGGATDDDTTLPLVPEADNSELGRIGAGVLSGLGRSVYDAATLPGDVYAGKVAPDSPQEIGGAANLAGLLTLGAGAAPAEADALRMGIKAYHGSPHDFDAFDLSKIGTGEGAQAYGHGLYFAENPGVAQSYRDALSNSQSVSTVTPHGQALYAIQNFGDGAIPWLQKKLANETHEGLRSRYSDAIDLIKSGSVKPAGRMYEVDINADPERFLDWDKPLSEQPKAVREAFSKAAVPSVQSDPILSELFGNEAIPNEYMGLFNKSSGAQAYNTLASERGGPPAFSQALSQAGVPGIKYLDQGSRAAGKGSRNYVLFDANLVNILRKYGLAGLPAAGVAAGAVNDNGQKHAEGGPVRNPAVKMALNAVNRAKGGKVHVGPIVGNRPGRTDVHPMKVPDGAYVLSADVVSHLGQNNTDAGLKVAQHLFGEGGEFDKRENRRSGGKTLGSGKPVDCVTAGGEFVIPPSVVASIGHGNMDLGHRILDAWSMNIRKDHIKTLASLPPPAQD